MPQIYSTNQVHNTHVRKIINKTIYVPCTNAVSVIKTEHARQMYKTYDTYKESIDI
jgi:hypothetical protein